MTSVVLRADTSRAQLRRAHEALAETESTDAVSLHLGDGLSALTPGQASAWLQLVLTWGQGFDERILVLEEPTVEQIVGGHDLPDHLVLAIFLASSVRRGDEDITEVVSPVARAALEQRVALTEYVDGGRKTSSILLAAHTFTNRTSPELHERWMESLGIEETARTLYHDLWPQPGSTNTLRPPHIEFGEHAEPPTWPTHITRARDLGTSEEFLPLSARLPSPRGVALDLATTVRQQPKPLQDEIGEILFELVQNTEWHALTSAGGRTGANCRAVVFRSFSFAREELGDAMDVDPHFVRYLVAVANDTQSRTGRRVEALTVGTITVVDSGIGLARSVATALGQSHLYSPETEVSYLNLALKKSLKTRREMLGAIGLARVQQSLANLRGFMSIRTGTVELMRDFVTNAFEPLGDTALTAPPSVLVDWIPPTEDQFVVGPRIGTAVSIAYPVDIEVADG